MTTAKTIIERYKVLNPTLDDAKQIFESYSKELSTLKQKLGDNSSSYIEISSDISNDLQLILYDLIKKVENEISNPQKHFRAYQIIQGAFILNIKLGKFEMTQNFRQVFSERFEEMHNIQGRASFISAERGWMLSGMNEKGEPIYQEPRQTKGNSSGGCYIATMAYGNYDHPQVMELRKFRDDFLSKTVVGRSFIKFYYAYSPKLVRKLKHKKQINAIIRTFLDMSIKILK